ncbi:MAG TPA: hypothetical protein VN512_13035 [Clostridia bacterium]|nr:hypothetical protein [Clostridia bacterium]
MTDINPMWRIKTLTEQFGPCGIGWRYEITDKQLCPSSDGTIAAFVDINLYYNEGGAWSEAIPGTGGAMFAAKEKAGLYTDDDCFKKALTDAISVAAKALGIGADVYWEKDGSKYDNKPQDTQKEPSENDKLILEILNLGKERSIEAACQKKFGKGLRKLSTDELKTVRDLMKENEAQP